MKDENSCHPLLDPDTASKESSIKILVNGSMLIIYIIVDEKQLYL